MRSLASLIALRCFDIQILNSIESSDDEMEEKRQGRIRTNKEEIRWLIRQYMRMKCEVDYGASDDSKVKVDLKFGEVAVSVMAKAVFNGDGIRCEPIVPKGWRPDDFTNLFVVMEDLVRQVPEAVATNLKF